MAPIVAPVAEARFALVVRQQGLDFVAVGRVAAVDLESVQRSDTAGNVEALEWVVEEQLQSHTVDL